MSPDQKAQLVEQLQDLGLVLICNNKMQRLFNSSYTHHIGCVGMNLTCTVVTVDIVLGCVVMGPMIVVP